LWLLPALSLVPGRQAAIAGVPLCVRFAQTLCMQQQQEQLANSLTAQFELHNTPVSILLPCE
jgi:hypothetical protein